MGLPKGGRGLGLTRLSSKGLIHARSGSHGGLHDIRQVMREDGCSNVGQIEKSLRRLKGGTTVQNGWSV